MQGHKGLGVGQRGHWLYSYFLWNFILFVLRRQIHITWVIGLFQINFLKARLAEAEIGINGIKKCELWPRSLLSTSRIFSVLILHPPFSFFSDLSPSIPLTYPFHEPQNWGFQVLGWDGGWARGRKGWRSGREKAQAREWLSPAEMLIMSDSGLEWHMCNLSPNQAALCRNVPR